MTRDDMAALYAIVSCAVIEPASQGTMYAALIGRMDLGKFQSLVSFAITAGLLVEADPAHHLVATTKGREFVALLDAEIAKVQA